jgi:MYXO-CTERM domain-containing protein
VASRALLAVCLAGATLAPATARAHPTIAPGDVAVVAISTGSAGPARFSFVALVDFHPVETVTFTDRGWLAAGRFRDGEGLTYWDVDRFVPRGTVVELPGVDGGFELEPRADQLFAFVGTLMPDGTPTDALLYGLNLGGPWVGDATSSGTSALPASLAGFEVALGSSGSCAYAGPTTGARSELLALIADASQWTCSDTEVVPAPSGFTVHLDRGEVCTGDEECTPGDFCADGVCCDSECRRDEAGHCQTCDFGPGDPRTGTCGPAPTTHLCRLAGGPCDPMDRCDGVSLECPPNVILGPSEVCRPSAGGCDPAEVCDGASAACPPDARAAPGSVCRPSRGVCDVEERCGDGSECPADEVVADGTECDDGLVCTAESSCSDGLCAGPVPRECDDGDACTADACSDEGGCTNAPIDGCCHDDADCDDGDPCTVDGCGVDGFCVPSASTLCLDAGAERDAGDGGVAPAPGGGCGCATTGGDASAGWLLAALALARRRRRR